MRTRRSETEADSQGLQTAGNAEYLALGEAAEEINRCLAAGREPEVNVLAARHPGLEAQIRQLVETLKALHELGCRTDSGDAGRAFSDFVATPASLLGDYRLIRELGRGGMGIVYEAEQVSLGRRVALKVLPFAAVLDQRQLARFRNEAHAAAQLHHTHIVPVYSVGCERGVHYYAMQFIDGRDLGSVIDELRELTGSDGRERRAGAETPRSSSSDLLEGVTPGSTTRTRAYFRAAAELVLQAATALEHAHELGILHRDIKPSNLLLDGRGKLWVTDFGLARFEKDAGMTRSGDLLGTLRYMSPEQALAKRVPVDHRTDIYSLGVTLYELLTLEPPFVGKDREEILRRIAFEEPRPPRRAQKGVPVEIETIVLKAMAKNPEERYATAREFAEDLERHLEDRPIQARRPGLPRRLFKWSRRRKGLVVATAAIVMSLSVASALMFREHLRAKEDEYARIVLRAVERIEMGRSKHERRWGQRLDADVTKDPLLLAVDELEGAANLFPDRPSAHLQRARALNLLSRDQEALEELDRLDLHFLPGRILRRIILASKECNPEARELSDQDLKTEASPWAEPLLEANRIVQESRWRVVRESRWKVAAGAYARLLDLAQSEVEDGQLYLGLSLEARLGRGQAFLAAGELDGAMEDFGAAMALWPELIGPVILLGKAYCLKGRPEVAEEKFQKLVSRLQHPGEAALAIASVYYDLKGYEKAVAWAARAPETSEREGLLAHYLLELGRPEDALRHGERSVLLDRGSAHAHYHLGHALLASRRLDEAIQEFREAIAIAPRAAVHADLAFALQQQGQLDEAVAEYRRAIELLPCHSGFRQGLGAVLAIQGKLDEAIVEFRAACALHPGEATAVFNLGNALAMIGKLDEAIELFGRATAIDPGSSKYQFNLGAALGEQGRTEEAIVALQRAIELDHRNAEAHLHLGIALQKQGEQGEAIAAYRQAIAVDPERSRPHLHFNLGRALYFQHELDEAIAEYRKSIQLDATHADTYSNLGLALGDQGNLEEAMVEYRKALALDPGNAAALNNVGVALCKQGQWEEGIERFCRVLEIHPGSPQARDNLLEALEGAVEPTRGLGELQAAVERTDCQDSGLLVLLALFHARSGNLSGAIPVLEEALALDREDRFAIAKLEAWCRSLLPDLPTFRSIDLALDLPEPLVPEGAEWSYFPGRSEPSELEWAALDFDAAAWKVCRSELGHTSEGWGPVLDGLKTMFSTLYLRHAFTLADPSRFSGFRLSVKSPGGFIAFLNGVEVGRDRAGAPGERLRFDAVASGEAPWPPAPVDLPIPASLFVPGRNVLALQVLRAEKEPPVFTLTPVLLGELPQDAARDHRLLEELRAAVHGDDAPARIAYLEGRILQRAGRHGEAAKRFEGLLGPGPGRGRPEPLQRLVECLRATGDAAGAEARLRAVRGGEAR